MGYGGFGGKGRGGRGSSDLRDRAKQAQAPPEPAFFGLVDLFFASSSAPPSHGASASAASRSHACYEYAACDVPLFQLTLVVAQISDAVLRVG